MNKEYRDDPNFKCIDNVHQLDIPYKRFVEAFIDFSAHTGWPKLQKVGNNYSGVSDDKMKAVLHALCVNNGDRRYLNPFFGEGFAITYCDFCRNYDHVS